MLSKKATIHHVQQRQDVQLVNPFELLRRIDENGKEYWNSEELRVQLEYEKSEDYEKIIKRAILSCRNSGMTPRNHFSKEHAQPSFRLTRYACYLVSMNGDPFLRQVSLAQAYFAIQTRKAELFEELMQRYHLSQDEISNALEMFLLTNELYIKDTPEEEKG